VVGTMTTTAQPVPLPPGTSSLDGWQDDEQLGTYRIISGTDRWPAGREVVIGTSAVQLADGSVDDGRVEDGPTVWLGASGDQQLTPAAAREIGEALIAAADEIGGWIAK
jgi:hypothetical protein